MSFRTTLGNVSKYIKSCIVRTGRGTLFAALLWTFTLWWGERLSFEKSVAACDWTKWEIWPAEATPHHILFIADPQLVDPHTYPGRPWPLSTLTVLYTDLYLRRSYGYLLERMQPQTTIFLGDLFDGGREWAALDYKSPEDRYKKYDTNFWLREYNRFMNMFISGWFENNWEGHLTGEGRKLIASLPGNHDLGFAGGINKHVRNRFEAHFGPSNRIDVMGNHTFVSLDTVSLSAMDQVDQSTGGSGAGDGTGESTKHMEIWRPVEGFLLDAKKRRAKAVQRRYEHFKSLAGPNTQSPERAFFDPIVKSMRNSPEPTDHQKTKNFSVPSSNFPTILLSHVPLYRNQDVTCGPLRERGNAIPLSAGYQYQNVLTPAVSKDIIDHLNAEEVTMIYSGDDHDYCEIEHGEFTGRIKEITVKSMSWAMGVRKPGIQLVSLWNPINIDAISEGNPPKSTPRDTVQNHLCLLPDQLSIFIRYGQALILSLLILTMRALFYKSPNRSQHGHSKFDKIDNNSQPLLPLSKKRNTPPSSPQLTPITRTDSTNNNGNINANSTAQTPSQTARSRPRSRSKSNTKLNTSYGNIPASSRSGSSSPIPNNSNNYYPPPPPPPSSSVVVVTPTKQTAFPGDTDDWGMPQTQAQSSYPYPYPSSYSQNLQSMSLAHHSSFQGMSRALRSTVVGRWIEKLFTPASGRLTEFGRSLILVAVPTLGFYALLLWNG